MQNEAMAIVRSDLYARIDSIAIRCGKGRAAHLIGELDLIRRDAHLTGLDAASQLASTVSRMMMAGLIGRKGGGLRLALDLMRDAVACDDQHGNAGAVYLAALSSRLGH